MSSTRCKMAWNLGILRPIPFFRIATLRMKHIRCRCLALALRRCLFIMASLFSHPSHWSNVSRRETQSSWKVGPNSLAFLAKIWRPVWVLMATSMTNTTPVCSFDINLPARMPLENIVLGLSRMLWRLNNFPISLQSPSNSSANLEVSPNRSKNVSLT